MIVTPWEHGCKACLSWLPKCFCHLTLFLNNSKNHALLHTHTLSCILELLNCRKGSIKVEKTDHIDDEEERIAVTKDDYKPIEARRSVKYSGNRDFDRCRHFKCYTKLIIIQQESVCKSRCVLLDWVRLYL